MIIVDNYRPPCIACVIQKQGTDKNNLLTSPTVEYFNSDTLAVCQEKEQEWFDNNKDIDKDLYKLQYRYNSMVNLSVINNKFL